MRLGISEILWMLPKILRIRRELVLSPLVVLRGASIALVAMCFPALCEGAREAPREVSRLQTGHLWSAAPLPSPMRAVRAPFGPCPGEDGKSPGRTKPCGEAVYLLDLPDIGLFRTSSRAPNMKIERGGSSRNRPLCARRFKDLEVQRGRQEY